MLSRNKRDIARLKEERERPPPTWEDVNKLEDMYKVGDRVRYRRWLRGSNPYKKPRGELMIDGWVIGHTPHYVYVVSNLGKWPDNRYEKIAWWVHIGKSVTNVSLFPGHAETNFDGIYCVCRYGCRDRTNGPSLGELFQQYESVRRGERNEEGITYE